MENARDYVVTAEDLPVPDELLCSLPPHLPWSRLLLSRAGLGWRIRRTEICGGPVRDAAAGEGGGGGGGARSGGGCWRPLGAWAVMKLGLMF